MRRYPIDLRLVQGPELDSLLGADIARLTSNLAQPIEILEAGCGRSWSIHLSGLTARITGVDLDEAALDYRINEIKDLDSASLGDLRDRRLINAEKFDVIYSAFVLEHVPGAIDVMDNFTTWLRPGGVIIIRIPDRDTVFGFLGRVLPHTAHVFYERRILGKPNAGRPGHGPYRTIYDEIVGLHGMNRFCESRGLVIDRAYKTNFATQPWNTKPITTIEGVKWRMVRLAMAVGGLLSLGRLDSTYSDLALVIRRVQKSPNSALL